MSYIDTLFSLKNKVAVVTGGTGVLGSAMCKALAKAGASVVILGRRLHVAEVLARTITDSGGEAMAVSADVLVEDQLKDASAKILERFKRIDILINAAGGNMPGAIVPEDKDFQDLCMDDLKSVMHLNVLGTVLPSQIFGGVITQQGSGVIINISSMSAFIPLTRVVGYSAAKASVSNFTQWLAVELARKHGEKIRVNAIAPGFFLTEQNQTLLTHEDGTLTQRGETIIARTPFKRFGVPDELSGTLIWLCSDAASFVSGAVIPVDGAFHAFTGV